MKMWKVAAIACLLLVPSAFGAVSVKLADPGTGLSTAQVLPGGSITLNVNVAALTGSDVNTGVSGVSMFLETNKAGDVSATGRGFVAAGEGTIFNTWMTSNVNTWKTGVFATGAAQKDSGIMSSDGLDIYAPATIATLTFALPASLPIAYSQADPIKIMLTTGNYSNDDGSVSGSIGAAHSVLFTITPEPASMLLLAAGAAFFARRRKA